jgi:hypothetical protein
VVGEGRGGLEWLLEVGIAAASVPCLLLPRPSLYLGLGTGCEDLGSRVLVTGDLNRLARSRDRGAALVDDLGETVSDGHLGVTPPAGGDDVDAIGLQVYASVLRIDDGLIVISTPAAMGIEIDPPFQQSENVALRWSVGGEGEVVEHQLGAAVYRELTAIREQDIGPAARPELEPVADQDGIVGLGLRACAVLRDQLGSPLERAEVRVAFLLGEGGSASCREQDRKPRALDEPGPAAT